MPRGVLKSLAVYQRIAAEFNWQDRHEALAIIAEYGRDSSHDNQVGVWNALLDLSKGNLKQLRRFTDIALEDADRLNQFLTMLSCR